MKYCKKCNYTYPDFETRCPRCGFPYLQKPNPMYSNSQNTRFPAYVDGKQYIPNSSQIPQKKKKKHTVAIIVLSILVALLLVITIVLFFTLSNSNKSKKGKTFTFDYEDVELPQQVVEARLKMDALSRLKGYWIYKGSFDSDGNRYQKNGANAKAPFLGSPDYIELRIDGNGDFYLDNGSGHYIREGKWTLVNDDNSIKFEYPFNRKDTYDFSISMNNSVDGLAIYTSDATIYFTWSGDSHKDIEEI